MLVILPVIVPLICAAASLVFWKSLRFQQALGVTGSCLQTICAVLLLDKVRRDGIQVVQVGDWPAPYGISFVADHFSTLMVLFASVAGMLVLIFSIGAVDRRRQAFAYYTLTHVLLTGVTAASMTGDVFNLYVWFEVMLIASFVLLALGGERPQLEGAVKYVTLNLVSSFLLLSAVAILYGAVGTLNFADVARKLDELDNQDLAATLAMLFMIALGIKSAVFPLFFWLPASYHTPPAAVSALFAGLLTKVGVYALIRIFTLWFPSDIPYIQPLLLGVAALTMLTGVLGTVAQYDFRRILSFHIISQIGYIVFGMALFTPIGLAGAIYFIAHQMVVKTNLFLVCGIVEWRYGSADLNKIGGLFRKAPWLAGLFAISAMSLAGIPPLSGFIGKLALFRAGFEDGAYIPTAIAVVVSVLTLFSMSKIWNLLFWTPPSAAQTEPIHDDSIGRKFCQFGPVVTFTFLTIAMGVFAQPLFAWTLVAANELLEPLAEGGYVQAVLGAVP